MKKIIAILLTLMMVFSYLSAYAVSTAQSVYNANKSTPKDQYFTTFGKIELNSTDTNPQFVTLLVTTDGSISVDSIMFIDQTVANSDGTFSFTDYIPKINVPVGGKYVVKVGATSLGQAISGGYLEVRELKGHAVSGTVSSKGTTNATLKLKQADVVVGEAVADANGAFSMENIPDGEYQLVITKKAHLPELVPVTVSGGDLVLPQQIRMLAGDIVATDKKIGPMDLSRVIDIFGAKSDSEYYKTEYDIDDDGRISSTELSAIIDNFGAKADALCYE